MNSLINKVKQTQAVKPKSSSYPRLFRRTNQHVRFKPNTSLTGSITSNGKTNQKLHNFLCLKQNSTTTKSSREQSTSIHLESPIPIAFANQIQFKVNDFNMFYNVLLKHNKINQSLILDTIEMPDIPYHNMNKSVRHFHSALPHPRRVEASNMKVNYEYCGEMLQNIRRKIELVGNPRDVFMINNKKEAKQKVTRSLCASANASNSHKSKFHQSDILSLSNHMKKHEIGNKLLDLSLQVDNKKIYGNNGKMKVTVSPQQRKEIKKIIMHNEDKFNGNIGFNQYNNDPFEMTQRSLLETNKSIEYVHPTKRLIMMSTNKTTSQNQTKKRITYLYPKTAKLILKPKVKQMKNRDLSYLNLEHEQEPELMQIDNGMLFSLRKKNSIQKRSSSAMEQTQLQRKECASGRSNLINAPQINNVSSNQGIDPCNSNATPKLLLSKSTKHKHIKKMPKMFALKHKINAKKYYRRLKQIEGKTYTYIEEAKAMNKLIKGRWNKSPREIEDVDNDINTFKNSNSLTSRQNTSKDKVVPKSSSHLVQLDENNHQETRNQRRNSDIIAILSGLEKNTIRDRRLHSSRELPQEVLLRLSLKKNNKDKELQYVKRDSIDETAREIKKQLEKRKHQELQALKLNQDIHFLLNEVALFTGENQELFDEFKEKIHSLRHFSKEEYVNYLMDNLGYLEEEIKNLKQCNEQETRINMFVKELNVKRKKIMELKKSKKTKLRVIDGFTPSFQASILFDEDEFL